MKSKAVDIDRLFLKQQTRGTNRAGKKLKGKREKLT